MTEVDGKATGWRADYVGGKWIVAEKTVAKKKAAPKKKAAAKKTTGKAADK